jgi:mannosyltransferase
MKKLSVSFFLPIVILIITAVSIMTLFMQSIRLDEAQSIWVYTKSVPAFLRLTAEDVLVPLYGTILHFWMQLFGTNILATRTLSFIFFVLTVPVLYHLAKAAGNKQVATVTILFFAFSPFIVWYSNETRMYTLFLFVTAVNNLFFFKLFKSDGLSGKLGFFLSAVAGIYTHYLFIFQVVTQSLFVFAKLTGIIKSIDDFNYAPTVSSWGRYKHFAKIYFSLLIPALSTLIPWVMYVLNLGSISNSLPFIQTPTTFNIFQIFVQFLFGFQTSAVQGALISLWPLIILMIFIVFTQRKQLSISNIEYFIMITFLPILIIFAVSFIRPIFLARYLIFVTPTLFILLSAVFLSYSKRMMYVGVLAFCTITFFLLLNQNVSAQTPVKENYRGASEYLNEFAKPQDIIAVSSPFTIYPIEYYYTGDANISTIPQWNRFAHGPIPPFSEQKFVTQITDDKKLYRYMYLVLSYNQGYEPKIISYMDKHYQLKTVRNFSEGLQIRVYQLRYDNK